ncbi:transposase [Nostoc sp. UHCC 0702]|nr:transposase [Nostoc sp. UHCC 0702]
MIIYEFKVKGRDRQYRAIDDAIHTSQFIQNKSLRYWMDNKNVTKYDLNKYCAVLAAELWLEYFGHKYGKVTVAVPPHNTSQNCSNCGEKVKKSLSTRTHICPHCNYVADRDVNASINILKLGLTTVGHTGSYAWGDLPSWAVGTVLLSNGESGNQESPSRRSGECQ